MRRVAYFCVVLYAGLLAWVAAAGAWPVLHQFWTSDDAFFYLTIARNVARGLGSTFDGLSPTNGYQPLWLAALAGVFRVTGPLSPEAGVRVAFGLAGVCAVAGTVIVTRLVERVSAPPIVAVAAALGLLSSYGFWYFGLEAHLTVVMAGVLFTLVWRRWQSAVAHEPWSLPEALTLAVAAALVVLTRVDLVVWVAVLLLTLSASRSLTGGSQRLTRRVSMIEQGVSAAIVVAYLAMNRAMFGAWFPISAALRSKRPSLSWSALSFYHWVDSVHLAVLVCAAAVMLTVAARAASRTGRSALVGTRIGFGAALAAGVLLHTAVAVLCSVSVEPRYLVMSSAAVVVIIAILAGEALVTASPSVRTMSRAAVALGAACVALVLGSIALHRVAPPVAPGDLVELAEFRAQIAPVLTRDTVVFVVDYAGELAWFCDCHLINGDGLVNDWDYQRFVADRRVTDYLDARRVSYVIETSGNQTGDVSWVEGYDWLSLGAESFPIVGLPTASAVVHVGQFRLFRYAAR